MFRNIYMIAGWLSLATGIIGIVVPLLPTTPFLLLAAFFFSRGSERLHQWLVQHPRFGPPIRDWNEQGVIRPRAKVLAIALLTATVIYGVGFSRMDPTLKLVQAITMAAIATFLLTRPSKPR
jgi:uncharacterized membrane protein YbaN (DUF454 family)